MKWGFQKQVEGNVGIIGLDKVRPLNRHRREIDFINPGFPKQYQQVADIGGVLKQQFGAIFRKIANEPL